MSGPRVPRTLLVPPLLAVLMLGFSLTVASEGRPVQAVRIVGGPTDSLTEFRGRIQLVADREGVQSPIVGQRLSVFSDQGRSLDPVQVVTGSEGWAELVLPAPPAGRLHLEVMSEDGRQLLNGSAQLSSAQWAERAGRRGLEARRGAEGATQVDFRVEGAVLAVPFPSWITVGLTRAGLPLSGRPVRLQSRGGQIEGSSSHLTDASGQVRVRLTPQEHTVSLTLKSEVEGEPLDYHQELVVIPGAPSFERRGEEFIVRSAVPRHQIWFAFLSRQARGPGGKVELQEVEGGIFEGRFRATPESLDSEEYLLLSGDPWGPSLGTIGVPLGDQRLTFDAADILLLDSLPRARQNATNQARRARFILGVYVLVAGLVTLLMFWVHLRRSDRVLEARLRRVGVTSEARDASAIPILAAILSLFFAFSLAVLWILRR